MRRLLGVCAGAILIALGAAHLSLGTGADRVAMARTPTPTPTPTPSDDPHDPPPGGIGGGSGGGGGGGNPPVQEIRLLALTATWRKGAVAGGLRGDAACIGHARVVLDRRGRKIASARTTSTGRYRIKAVHRSGRYRVRAPAVQRTAATGPVYCRAASHVVG